MHDFLIIGAGLSGLCAAHELRKHGFRAVLVDKGRGLGGRMATRRFEGATFDHGAQFFTARNAEFQAQTQLWIENGVAKEWFRGYPSPENAKPDDAYPRFCGTRGMTGISKFLAQDLEVHLGEEIEFLERESEIWRAKSQSGAVFEAPNLILTAPVPQSLALLRSGGANLPLEAQNSLENLVYETCFAVLCVLDGPSKIPAPGALYVNGDPIWWLADNFQKGISPVEGAMTIHSSARFAREFYEHDQNEVGKILLESAKKWLGAEIKAFQVRRWRYSKPENPSQNGAVWVPELRLAFAGDALSGAKIEGAFSSGIEAARAFLEE